MEIDFLTLDDFDVKGKAIFVRVDINSPIDPISHQILDDSRIKSTLETLECLARSRVVIGSHQSRPGKGDFTSLEIHSKILGKYCSQQVKFVADVIGPHAVDEIKGLREGEILVLDNLRMCAEEVIEAQPEKLAKTHFVTRLAPLFDLYLNDAFAAAHRSQPSLAGLPEVLPSAAGKLMERELRSLNVLLGEPERPCLYILGGAKVEDKIPVMEHILEGGKADKILMGGVPAKVFLKASGFRLSPDDEKEMIELDDYVKRATAILSQYRDVVELPMDVAIETNRAREEYTLDGMNRGTALDVGAKTLAKYAAEVRKARTIVANGPLGVFERNGFDHGTRTILQQISETDAYTVIGGGHLAGLASLLGIQERFSHVSTAGGAMLSLLAGEKLPAVEALRRAARRVRKS